MAENGKKGLGAIFGGSFLKLRVETPFHGLEMKNIHKKLVKTHVYSKLKVSVFEIKEAQNGPDRLFPLALKTRESAI